MPTAQQSQDDRFRALAAHLRAWWDLLEVHATPAATQPADDRAAAVAAGYFEGKATAAAIEHAAINAGIPTFELTPALAQYIAANEQFVAAQTTLAASSLPTGHADRRIWYHVDLVRAQLEGLLAGYLEGRAALARPPLAAPLNATGLLLMNMGGDLEDLDHVGTCNATAPPADGTAAAAAAAAAASPVFDPGRCSALIRLLPGNADVLVAQDTWAGLNSMLRIYKLYDLPFAMSGNEAGSARRSVVPASRVSFSSYPGVLNSGDDFYLLSSGLVQLETTIGNASPELAARFVSPMVLTSAFSFFYLLATDSLLLFLSLL